MVKLSTAATLPNSQSVTQNQDLTLNKFERKKDVLCISNMLSASLCFLLIYFYLHFRPIVAKKLR